MEKVIRKKIISLSFGSITTNHIQMYSDPTLITVSSLYIQEYSEIFFFFVDISENIIHSIMTITLDIHIQLP